LDPAEERERERLTAAERDGAGGREERPEERKRFQGTDFLFSKKKKKKRKRKKFTFSGLYILYASPDLTLEKSPPIKENRCQLMPTNSDVTGIHPAL
jgi:hypothetical protein